MNLGYIENIFVSSNIIKNNHYFSRYLKVIAYYKNSNAMRDKEYTLGEIENHHILPVAIFPEYAKENWNIVSLPTKTHYLVHYILYKCIKHRSCVFAFNQMRRVTNAKKPNCRLYAAVRKDFALLISMNNTGAVRSTEWCANHSTKMSGTNIYRNTQSKELKRFRVGLHPTGWEPFQLGRVRTEDSKKSMSDKSTGRRWQYNEKTKELRFEHYLLPGFTKGYPKWAIANKEYLNNLVWVHNKDTAEEIRININDDIPTGYTAGRLFNNVGLNIINNSNLCRVVDLKEKKFCLINKDALPDLRYAKHGQSLDEIFLFCYNKNIFTCYQKLSEYYPELPAASRRDKSYENKLIPKPHHNMTKERQEFCKKHNGRTLQSLGLEVIALQEFNYDELKEYIV